MDPVAKPQGKWIIAAIAGNVKNPYNDSNNPNADNPTDTYDISTGQAGIEAIGVQATDAAGNVETHVANFSDATVSETYDGKTAFRYATRDTIGNFTDAANAMDELIRNGE